MYNVLWKLLSRKRGRKQGVDFKKDFLFTGRYIKKKFLKSEKKTKSDKVYHKFSFCNIFFHLFYLPIFKYCNFLLKYFVNPPFPFCRVLFYFGKVEYNAGSVITSPKLYRCGSISISDLLSQSLSHTFSSPTSCIHPGAAHHLNDPHHNVFSTDLES